MPGFSWTLPLHQFICLAMKSDNNFSGIKSEGTRLAVWMFMFPVFVAFGFSQWYRINSTHDQRWPNIYRSLSCSEELYRKLTDHTEWLSMNQSDDQETHCRWGRTHADSNTAKLQARIKSNKTSTTQLTDAPVINPPTVQNTLANVGRLRHKHVVFPRML